MPVRILGHGTFGCVKLVQHPATGKVMALKTMQKHIVVQLHQQKNVFMEKEILMQLDHPFILALYQTFQVSTHNN